MPDELKCIETLLRYTYYDIPMKDAVLSEFKNPQSFNIALNHLLSLVSIHSIVNNFTSEKTPSETFLTTGKIPFQYDEQISTPTIDSRYANNPKKFFITLVAALKKGKYLFDEDNNIYVSDETIETLITPEWLYRFSQTLKRSNYSRAFFFNKFGKKKIKDEEDLEKYLYHSKTFIVEIHGHSSLCEKLFNRASRNTEAEYRGKKEVRVNEIIEFFLANIERKYGAKATKYQFPSKLSIIKLANKLGPDFYDQLPEVQEKYLNKWLQDSFASNNLSDNEVQKLIALVGSKSDIKSRVDKPKVIAGLFRMYIQTITEYDIDFNDISLSDFKIKTHLSESLQALLNQLDLLEESRVSSTTDETERALAKKVSEAFDILKGIDGFKSPEDLDIAQEQYLSSLNEYYTHRTRPIQVKNQTIEEIKKRIAIEEKQSLEGIAFDNNKIMSLIKKACETGEIYIDPLSEKKLIIELHNRALGKTIFKAEISLERLLLFIENNNFNIEDGYQIYRCA